MAAWFGRKRKVTPTIDSFSFAVSGWKYHGERRPNEMRVWETPEGDAVSLHFFGIPPDIPAADSIEGIAALYAEGLRASGAKVVECSRTTAADCPCVRLVIKAPQQPSGMMYQGMFTLPFRDFSFVVKIQCPEVGETGFREAILLAQRMKAGETPNTSGSGPVLSDWDPDAPEHDTRFPKHPISRLRRLLAHVQSTATIDGAVRALPCFRLPGAAP
jgi:hypothetical protein